MSESNYKAIIDDYLSNLTSVDEFINAYFHLWKTERDNGMLESYDPKFQRMVDRIFTSCDCYDEAPQRPHEITETELRNELDLLRHIWWG
jgi:hypothetical protein